MNLCHMMNHFIINNQIIIIVKTVTLGQHSSRVGYSTRACPQFPLHEVTKIVAFPTGCCWSMAGYPQAFPPLSLKFGLNPFILLGRMRKWES